MLSLPFQTALRGQFLISRGNQKLQARVTSLALHESQWLKTENSGQFPGSNICYYCIVNCLNCKTRCGIQTFFKRITNGGRRMQHRDFGFFFSSMLLHLFCLWFTSYCSGLLMQSKCKAAFVQRWVIACWTCLGKLAPRGQRHSCVYLSSEWMWLCFPLTMWLLRCLCFSSKSSFPFSERLSTFHSGKLNMDLAYLRKCFRVGGSCGSLLACDEK